MKLASLICSAILALGFAVTEAEAAKRFGGGSSLGKQRPAPTMREAPKPAPAATPNQSAQPAQAAPAAATPATPAAKPSFMSRFGGVLAGLGLGALLGSLFAGGFGSIAGIILLALLAGVAFMAWRAYAARRSGAPAPMEFAGAGAPAGTGPAPVAAPEVAAPTTARRPLNIGAGVTGPVPAPAASEAEPRPIPGFEAEPFLRVAKTSFIRLQAANDAKDLDDIRDFTTPELYAEIAMQIRERGDAPQKTEVVSVNASLVEAVLEGDYAIASVRFTGLIREAAGANPEPFDEIWHVRQDQRDRKATWLIAGIQQVA